MEKGDDMLPQCTDTISKLASGDIADCWKQLSKTGWVLLLNFNLHQ